jgi:dihydroorotate dehydrogenase
VQLYSALVFDGPELVTRIKRGLMERVKSVPLS